MTFPSPASYNRQLTPFDSMVSMGPLAAFVFMPFLLPFCYLWVKRQLFLCNIPRVQIPYALESSHLQNKRPKRLYVPLPAAVWQACDFCFVSFAVISALFAMIFKMLPNVLIGWHDVRIGAVGTALLFTIGKFLIGLYHGTSSIASSFGAAGFGGDDLASRFARTLPTGSSLQSRGKDRPRFVWLGAKLHQCANRAELSREWPRPIAGIPRRDGVWHG